MIFANKKTRGFTLLEFFVVFFILAVLAALIVATYSSFAAKSEGVKCAVNLRNLHVAFSGYIQDKGHWPQEPLADKPEWIEDWWLYTMKPYGAEPLVWQCPTIRRKISAKNRDGRPKIHYSPTLFDARPGMAFRWSTQPWFIEAADAHGSGPLLCFPDGSIRSMDEVLANK